jgi:hypothetical protein
MRNWILVGVLALAAPAWAQKPAPTAAKPESSKTQAIRQLLVLTSAAQLGQQVLTQVLTQLKPLFPNAPAKFWTDFAKEAKADDLVEQIVPIYDKYLSEPEIRDLIKFYESPVGKKLVSVQPQLVQESMTVGQTWGRAIGESVVKKLQAQGLSK